MGYMVTRSRSDGGVVLRLVTIDLTEADLDAFERYELIPKSA